jgi:uncharacterized membrane protein YidH (DUF202 family)
MDQMEMAHHELDRLQDIITRHEGFMFTLRGWLLAIIGGLLTAYYSQSIDISAALLRIALLTIVGLFLVLESRHMNLVEAVVDRATKIEELIRQHRFEPPDAHWYDGPRVSEACLDGANRNWPKKGMTYVLNHWFYIAVVLVVILTTVSLPEKHPAAKDAASQSGQSAPK